MEKEIIKFDDTGIEEYEFYQYKKLMKQQYIISLILVSKILNILFVTKIIKKLDLYAYYFQK